MRLRLALLRRVEVPVLRDEPVFRERVEELVLRVEEVLRRVVPPPVAVFAAFWAAFAACSKSLRIALPNFVESLRASERNLPRPL